MSQDDGSNELTAAVANVTAGVLASAPTQAMAMLYQTLAAALAGSLHNATASQQAAHQIGTALVSSACARILALAPPTERRTP